MSNDVPISVFKKFAETFDVPEIRSAIETAEANGHREVREPLVYQSTGTESYYRDLWEAGKGDVRSAERIERHQRQMAVIPRAETRQMPGTNFEYRVNPSPTLGQGGEFDPPLWLNELFATAPRPGEVIQRLVREKGHEFTMPSGVSSISVPRVTKGTLVNDSTAGTPADDQDVESKEVKAQALVYGGNSDWSIQALEQSPPGAHLDRLIFIDMGESLDASLEEDLIAGKGESMNEALGLLNISGINTVEYASLEAKTFFTEIGKLKAKVGVERRRPPDAWLATTSRIAWMALTEDKEQQRPLILTDNVGEEWPEASLAGTALYPDDAIPRTTRVKSTETANQEPMFCVRADDFMLWHSPIKTMVMADVLSGSLEVRFQLYRTTASMLHRYPSGISVIVGAGMKPATEY